MGQAEIMKILERKKGKWVSTIEIRIKLNQTASVITRALNKMLHYGEVEKRRSIIKKDSQRYVFFWCIK